MWEYPHMQQCTPVNLQNCTPAIWQACTGANVNSCIRAPLICLVADLIFADLDIDAPNYHFFTCAHLTPCKFEGLRL
jgi:hypothetical protein